VSEWGTDAASLLLNGAAARRGWRLARILEESDGRHRLEEALQRIESGETDGLIVTRLPDLGETLPEAVRTIDRIRAAGGTLLSVIDQVELGADTGLLTWRLLVSLAEW
jgi:DNA invertase Pin-like site-specific DNA recombinase